MQSGLHIVKLGKGLINYDAIFTELKSAGFNNWISIKNGVNGIEQLERSVSFLRKKMNDYLPDKSNQTKITL